MEEKGLPENILKERKKLSIETHKKIRSFTFFNCIWNIIMIILVLIVNISFNKFSLKDFNLYIKVVQMFMAIISIVILEIAYRKDSGKIAINGIEFAIFGVDILFVPYMYISKNNPNYLTIVISIFTLYYIIKSIIVALVIRHKYIKENISDVKEIIKEESPKSYIEEASKKTLQERKIKDENKQKAYMEKRETEKVKEKRKIKLKKD